MAPVGTFLLGGRPKSLEIGHGQKSSAEMDVRILGVEFSISEPLC